MSYSVAVQTAIAGAVASLAVVGHKSLAVAPVSAVLSGDALVIERANKAGDKFVVRDVAGLMLSGNPAERAQAFAYLMAKALVNGEWGTIAKNVVRVFGAAVTDGMGYIKVNPYTGRVGADATMTNRQAWETILQNLADKHVQKPFKGEKLTALVALQCARATVSAANIMMQAEKDAALAAGTVASVVDGETRELPAFPELGAPTAEALQAELAEAMGEAGADATETAQDAQTAEAGADATVSA